MPTITLPGGQTIDARADQRLLRALLEADVDILHRCGGYARCTTCRVNFHEGEPDVMTEAERDKLREKDLLGEVRLSCQILCDHDMTVEPVYSLAESDLSDAGPDPEPHITPEPVWIERAEA